MKKELRAILPYNWCYRTRDSCQHQPKPQQGCTTEAQDNNGRALAMQKDKENASEVLKFRSEAGKMA